jgi:hypothetical protein
LPLIYNIVFCSVLFVSFLLPLCPVDATTLAFLFYLGGILSLDRASQPAGSFFGRYWGREELWTFGALELWLLDPSHDPNPPRLS